MIGGVGERLDRRLLFNVPVDSESIGVAIAGNLAIALSKNDGNIFNVDSLGKIRNLTSTPWTVFGDDYARNIIHCTGNVFLLSTSQFGEGSWVDLWTFYCDPVSGSVSDSCLDFLWVDPLSGYYSKLVKIENSSNIYALLYSSRIAGVWYGRILTFSITTDGMISAIIDSWLFDNNTAVINNIFHISGNIYAVYAMRDDGHYRIYTFEIQPDGTLPAVDMPAVGDDPAVTGSLIDWKPLNPAEGAPGHFGRQTDIIPIGNNQYVATLLEPYLGVTAGFIYTLSISDTGEIAAIDKGLLYGLDDGVSNKALYPTLVLLGSTGSGNLIGIVSFESNTIKVFEVRNNGQIAKSFIQEMEFYDPAAGGVKYAKWITLSSLNNIVLLFYEFQDYTDFFFYTMIDTYQVFTPVSSPTLVTTLPATGIMR